MQRAPRGYDVVRAELPQPIDHAFGPALAAACASVTSADGCLADEERNQLLQRMHRLAAGAVLDIDDLIQTFDHLLESLISDAGGAEAESLALTSRVRNNPDLSSPWLTPVTPWQWPTEVTIRRSATWRSEFVERSASLQRRSELVMPVKSPVRPMTHTGARPFDVCRSR